MSRFASRAGIAALAIAVQLAVSMASCAPKRTVVEFWQSFEVSRYDSLIASFESANPTLTVHVRMLPARAMTESLAAAVAHGTPPDLCVLDSTAMPLLMERGELSDWSAGVADLRDSLVGWELCSVGDALYGMPWLLDTRVLYYNAPAFARAGLDPEVELSSWSAIESLCGKRPFGGLPTLGFPTDDALAISASCLLTEGGLLEKDSEDSLAVDGPIARAAFDRLERIRALSYLGEQLALESSFAAGQLAIVMAEPRLATRLKGKKHWDVAPLPHSDSTWSGFSSGLVLASLTRSPHKEAALRWARVLASPSQADRCARAFPDLVPATRSPGVFSVQAQRDHYLPVHGIGGPELVFLGLCVNQVVSGLLDAGDVTGWTQERLDFYRHVKR